MPIPSQQMRAITLESLGWGLPHQLSLSNFHGELCTDSFILVLGTEPRALSLRALYSSAKFPAVTALFGSVNLGGRSLKMSLYPAFCLQFARPPNAT